MNTLCENLNKEPADGTDQTVSELFSLKLLCENTKRRASHRLIFVGGEKEIEGRERERGGEQLLDTPQRLINESARGEQGERGRDLPLSLFQMKSFRIPLSPLPSGNLMKGPAFVLRGRPYLRGTDTFSRPLAEPCSHGASAAPSSIRCIIKYGQRRWQALTGYNEVDSARAKSLNIQAQ